MMMQSSHIGQIDEDDRKIICEFVTKSFNSNANCLVLNLLIP